MNLTKEQKYSMTDIFNSIEFRDLIRSFGHEVLKDFDNLCERDNTESITYKRYKLSEFSPHSVKITPIISADGNFLNINLSLKVGKVEE